MQQRIIWVSVISVQFFFSIPIFQRWARRRWAGISGTTATFKSLSQALEEADSRETSSPWLWLELRPTGCGNMDRVPHRRIIRSVTAYSPTLYLNASVTSNQPTCSRLLGLYLIGNFVFLSPSHFLLFLTGESFIWTPRFLVHQEWSDYGWKSGEKENLNTSDPRAAHPVFLYTVNTVSMQCLPHWDKLLTDWSYQLSTNKQAEQWTMENQIDL